MTFPYNWEKLVRFKHGFCHLQTHSSCLRRTAGGSDGADDHRQMWSAQGFPLEGSHFPLFRESSFQIRWNAFMCIASCYGHTGKREVTIKAGTGENEEIHPKQKLLLPSPVQKGGLSQSPWLTGHNPTELGQKGAHPSSTPPWNMPVADTAV